jgi:hypothetical protein
LFFKHNLLCLLLRKISSIMDKQISFAKHSFGQCLVLITLCIFLLSCNNNAEKQPDVSAVKVQLNCRHLDKDLKALDSNHLAEGLIRLEKQYPDFLNFYLDTLMGFNINKNFVAENKGISEGLHSFLTFKDYSDLFDTVAVHYPNTDDVEQDLIKGFQYLQHYYPGYKAPKIIYFVSGLSNWGVVSYEGVLGIGLDMFLGEKYPFYAAVGQPDYMYINFRKRSIAPSVFNTIYNDFHPFRDEEKNLLEMMIQRGKQQYFVEKMLPFVSLEDRIGYTKAQLDWCSENEAMIYNFFLNKNLMFEKNWGVMRRFVVYGPNTSGMPAESPGNIGTWLGLQIVKAYVKENPKVEIEQMFREENAEQFLKKSKYKPKK